MDKLNKEYIELLNGEGTPIGLCSERKFQTGKKPIWIS